VTDDLTTPTGVESHLRRLVSDLALAQQALATTRNEEVRCKHAYESAKRRATLSEACPKVSRGGATTAERDAWVGEAVAMEHWQYDVAAARREAAQDHMRVVRDQAMVVMALGKSVTAAYAVAGSGK
jgi:hypothetical protein